MNGEPKFSVVIPVYNSSVYLLRSIRSLIHQNYHNWEAIVVDDGSDEYVEPILTSFFPLETRIVCVREQNLGPFLARRAGMKKGSGDYFLFLDADDEYEPYLLSKMVFTIKKYEPDMIYFFASHFANGLKTYFSNHDGKIALLNQEQMFYQSFIIGHDNCTIWSKCVSKRVINECTLLFEPYNHYKNSEDLLQVFEFIIHSKKAVVLNEALYIYYQNNNSITHNLTYNLRFQSLSISSFIFCQMIDMGYVFNDLNHKVDNIFYMLFDCISTFYHSHPKQYEQKQFHSNVVEIPIFKSKYKVFYRSNFYKHKKLKCKVIVWLFLHKLFFLLRFIYLK